VPLGYGHGTPNRIFFPAELEYSSDNVPLSAARKNSICSGFHEEESSILKLESRSEAIPEGRGERRTDAPSARGASRFAGGGRTSPGMGAEPTVGGDDHRRRSPLAAIALAASACDSRPGEPVADRVRGPAGFDELLTDH
jgi:hypothetical protein